VGVGQGALRFGHRGRQISKYLTISLNKIDKMKKCQDCIANYKNMFCKLGYKTEHLKTVVSGYTWEYISPLEKCEKPKNKKDYIRKYKLINYR
jgi:hypothetical protein